MDSLHISVSRDSPNALVHRARASTCLPGSSLLGSSVLSKSFSQEATTALLPMLIHHTMATAVITHTLILWAADCDAATEDFPGHYQSLMKFCT